MPDWFSSLLFFSFIFIISACDFSEDDIQHDDIEVNLNIKRLDQAIFACESITEIDSLISDNREEFNLYLELDKLQDKNVLSEILFTRVQDSAVRVFYNQSQEIYGDFGPWERDLKHLFQHVKFYYPDFEAPQISTFFTAFLTPIDIVVSKEHIVIGLDYFIGPEAMYVQNDPVYILERYTPQNLVPMFVGLGISNFYNETNHEDQTLVADMIYFGKAHYFLSKMVHDLYESTNLGFKEEDISYFSENEKALWAYFVDQELLFETNRMETAKYLSERPKTVEIDTECPGRVGRWIGFRIVTAYMKKNNVSLQELMAEKDAQKIFNSSGYNPSR